MAPTNKTCIVIEVPCDKKDQIYSISMKINFLKASNQLYLTKNF